MAEKQEQIEGAGGDKNTAEQDEELSALLNSKNKVKLFVC